MATLPGYGKRHSTSTLHSARQRRATIQPLHSNLPSATVQPLPSNLPSNLPSTTIQPLPSTLPSARQRRATVQPLHSTLPSVRQRRATVQNIAMQPTFKQEEPLTSEIMSISNQKFGRFSSLEFLLEDAKVLHKKLYAMSLDLDLDKVGLADEDVDPKKSSKAAKTSHSVGSSRRGSKVTETSHSADNSRRRSKVTKTSHSADSSRRGSKVTETSHSAGSSRRGSKILEKSRSIFSRSRRGSKVTEQPPSGSSPKTEQLPKAVKSDAPAARPSVTDLIDELSEVEDQVGGGRPIERDATDSGSKRINITASTATMELDELMQNLSKFEPNDAGANSRVGGSEAIPKSAMDDLSSMLGSLDQEMTHRHGVSTTAKGVCAACNKQILAKVVSALGRQWHPEHFTCAVCEMELGHVTYYESDGRPYCEKDYHELFAPRCAYCNGPILERVMRALDKTWHPEHFFCTLCGKHFGPEGFHEKDSKAFCRECYYEKYAPRCKRCDRSIMEGFITAMNAQWHPECFSCKVCQVTFPRGNYFEHEGEPHCEIHYHASRGTLCASCQKPVTGKCITAMGKKWHPEHFTCAFCLKLLNKGTFKEHRHNPYCQPCFIKLFG